MSLRSKIFYILLALAGVAFLGQALVMAFIIFPDFVELEEQGAERDMGRIHQAIVLETRSVDILCHDWATWDHAVDFVEDRRDDFVAVNIPDNFFDDASVDYLHIVDAVGETKYRKAIDPVSGEDFVVRDEPSLFFKGNTKGEASFLMRTGLVFVGDVPAPLILVLRPIVKSDGSGPVAGTMVMGRFLDLDLLQQRVGVDLAFIPLAEIPAAGDERNALKLLQAGGKTPVLRCGQGRIYMYSLQQSIHGGMLSLLVAQKPADIRQRGAHATQVTMACYLAGCLFLLGAVYFLLSRIVTSPIRVLGQQTREIVRSGDFSGSILTRGHDEIADLGQGINGLLQRIVDHEKVIATVNTKLLLQSLTDPLTGLANRRHFDTYLGQEWGRLQRTKLPLAVLMCDVDYFKKYNDGYGHVRGDSCLQILATVLTNAVKRPADFPARYGGEEFVVLLPETDCTGAMRVAQRICDTVRGQKIEHAASDVSPWVTMSVGVACLVPDEGTNSDHLVRMADEALYKAKGLGRNQVVQFLA